MMDRVEQVHGWPCEDNEVFVPGATFAMGSDEHYPEERPAHPVTVDGFWMDAAPVTNRQFAMFVAATGYVTMAERAPNPKDYPGALPHMLNPGALVFEPPRSLPRGRDMSQWWHFKFGADWKNPYGPEGAFPAEADHPVVQVAYEDARAYADWAGKDLPTEAEWELAARGGLEGAEYAWGDELMPEGQPMANTWHGSFPIRNTLIDGFARTSPVGSFPANGYGLYDMIGNVWEWTSDYWSQTHPVPAAKPCCIPKNPRRENWAGSCDPRQPAIRIPRRVLKGGSHLCAPNYCRRYRPAARHAQPEDTSTTHIGFRCIRRSSVQAGHAIAQGAERYEQNI
jgi:formylglycine-generating enzyme required for sulfatase activity